MAAVTAAIRGAYARSAAAWATGPARMYDVLARALLAACPVPLAGRRVLDLGAGTGAASRVAAAAGARVVAVDAAAEMLAYGRVQRPPAAAGDAVRLPLRDRVFDAVLAAFVLNKLRDPVAALAESVRVTRPGGWVLASAFHAGWDHPAKALVDTVAARYGYRRPEWYDDLKATAAGLVGDTGAFTAVAASAGLAEVEVVERSVDVGRWKAADLVAWRLGMAHLAPFIAGLPAGARNRLEAEAVAAVGEALEPLRPVVLLCAGRRPPDDAYRDAARAPGAGL